MKNRTMVAADIGAFLLFGAFFSFIFLVTLLMQQMLTYSPTRTGVAWLATSLTSFAAAAITGAQLASKFGTRRLIIVGTSLLALSAALLTRVPNGADYPADLLPAFVLAGIAGGLAAPSIQISALTGVADHQVGLASGLVETMREIGGAVAIAAVSTVLVSRLNDGDASAAIDAFQSAFVVIVVFAALGALLAGLTFPRSPQEIEAPLFDKQIPAPETASAD